jgi:dTDP-4-dehydrorhamnose 3,5-epimerase
MKIINTNLKDCFIIENIVHEDNRGLFIETYQKKKFDEKIGIPVNFVQDNFSLSTKGVMRGLHFQKKFPQGKLVRVLKGKVFDVVVDIRKNSETFGSHFCLELNDENHLQLWIPEGFAHGFLTLSDKAYFEYKCTDYYVKEDEDTIHCKDPDLNIPWPSDINNTISQKDEVAKSFKDFISSLK